MKGVILERFQITLKNRMYKYFIQNNKYSYLAVINKLSIGYNISVHPAIGMPPTKISPSNIYSVWRMVNILRPKIPQNPVKYKVAYLVRVTKVNVRFAKGYEQTF